MKSTHIEGKIVQGYGKASEEYLHVYDQIKIAFAIDSLAPGTVNIKLPAEYSGRQDMIFQTIINDKNHKVFLERCKVFGKDAFILRTDPNYHGKNTIELVAQENIFKTYNLSFGDFINLEVFCDN